MTEEVEVDTRNCRGVWVLVCIQVCGVNISRSSSKVLVVFLDRA